MITACCGVGTPADLYGWVELERIQRRRHHHHYHHFLSIVVYAEGVATLAAAQRHAGCGKGGIETCQRHLGPRAIWDARSCRWP